MGDTVWYLNAAEGPVGPYAPVDLRQMHAAGQITDDWYVWREGLGEWMRFGDVAELQPSAAPAKPQPAPPSPPAAAAAGTGSELSGANVLARAVAAKAQSYGGAKTAAKAAPASTASVPATTHAAAPAPASVAVSPVSAADVPTHEHVGASVAGTILPAGLETSADQFPEPVFIRAPSPGKRIMKSLLRIGGLILGLAAVGGGVGYYLYGDELLVICGIVEPPPPPPAPPVPTMSEEEKQARETYSRYQKAIEAGDLGALEELLNADRAALLGDTTAGDLLEDLKAARPSKPATIFTADVSPDAVTLQLLAPGPTSAKLTGSALLVREEGAWKVAGETWQLPPPDSAALEAALFDSCVPGSGTAAIAKESVPIPAIGPESDVLRLVTGIEGSTDFTDSKRAVMEFRSGIGRDARRLEVAFDASRRGRQKIDGQLASLSFIASNAQVFAPDGEIFLEVTQPYTGLPGGVCRAVIKRMTLSSGGVSVPFAIVIEILGTPVRTSGSAASSASAPAAPETTAAADSAPPAKPPAP